MRDLSAPLPRGHSSPRLGLGPAPDSDAPCKKAAKAVRAYGIIDGRTRETEGSIMAERKLTQQETKSLIERAGFDKPDFDKVLQLIPPPEPKPGKELFDKVLQDAATRPEPTPDEWCAMGICPKCIHDMVTLVGGGQVCPECGFGTELQYIAPAERKL